MLKRPKRNKSARLRQPKQLTTVINQLWSMNIVADGLFDRRRLRALKVFDNYTREARWPSMSTKVSKERMYSIP